ncbi:GNAT family N-acetyltransferase [Streptomyces sp. NPDC048680]|uniref:GNAT family N-acetyltransferase n=1 Tax=Streptomyces sp. NPDC048680 TaxID=3155492 RepID=UPI0034433EBD
MSTGAVRVRHACPADLPHIARLAAEHARYEQAEPPPADLAGRLESLLFGTAAPRLRCFVAERDDAGIIGYATCAPELSTWDGAEYLSMDCLFLRDGHRGQRVGPLLVEAVRGEARVLGLSQIQWQTPSWNADAIRFYDRLGARAKEKRRFFLSAD